MNVLISGANRGIGLGLTLAYLQRGDHVIACCRDINQLQSQFKQQYFNLTLATLDVSDHTSIRNLSLTLKEMPIDVLINNAGVWGPEKQALMDLNFQDIAQTFNVNSIAPAVMAQILLSNIQQGKKKCIVNMSSQLGSTTENTSGNYYYYRASKAAQNAITKSLSIDLKALAITVIALHPGWLKTAMGGNDAPVNVEDGVKDIIKLIDQLDIQQTGTFLNHAGNVINW